VGCLSRSDGLRRGHQGLLRQPSYHLEDYFVAPSGSLDIVDGTGFQFTQDRGLIVIDLPLGLVAVLPVGMAQARRST
jgi:hypothetical protein